MDKDLLQKESCTCSSHLLLSHAYIVHVYKCIVPTLGQHESPAASSMDTLGAGMVIRLGWDCNYII